MPKNVCFWSEESFVRHPDTSIWEMIQNPKATDEVQSHIVNGYRNTNEAKAVVSFMRKGQSVATYRGSAKCRICGKYLGCSDMQNGGFVFPEMWEHYIEAHDVRPWDEGLIHVAIKQPNV